MGGNVGEVAQGGRARGEMGRGHQRAVWEQQRVDWFPLLGSLKNLTTGLIWLVRREGSGRKRGGRWPREGGQGGRWGGGTKKLVTVAGGGGSGVEVKTKGSEVERVDKMWSGGWPGLGKGEGRVWGTPGYACCGGRKADKKKVQMRGNGEGAKGTCWAPAPGVGGYNPYIAPISSL